jgi:hypothetical protein
LLDIQAIFEFMIKEPIMALIGGGILLMLVSIVVMQFSADVAGWFRGTGLVLVLLGFLALVLKMLPKLAK